MAKNGPPKDRADAFNKAIAALHNWTLEEKRDTAGEPSIAQRYSIGEICDLLEAFDGPKPENAYQFMLPRRSTLERTTARPLVSRVS
jgi:hypothetical protein